MAVTGPGPRQKRYVAFKEFLSQMLGVQPSLLGRFQSRRLGAPQGGSLAPERTPILTVQDQMRRMINGPTGHRRGTWNELYR
jgi:hypothetical protein